MANRGRGNKSLTQADLADIHALLAKGYYRKHIAALFDVQYFTLYKYLKEQATHVATPVVALPAKWGSLRLNWPQRVIWAMCPDS